MKFLKKIISLAGLALLIGLVYVAKGAGGGGFTSIDLVSLMKLLLIAFFIGLLILPKIEEFKYPVLFQVSVGFIYGIVISILFQQPIMETTIIFSAIGLSASLLIGTDKKK